MRYRLPGLALLLCLVAALTVTLDAPWQLRVLSVGAFVLLTPGLLVVHVLDLPDRLLALVVGLIVGPALWVVVATIELYAGLWSPRTTVLAATALLGVLAVVLAATGARSGTPGADEDALDRPAHDPRVEHHSVEDIG